MKITDKISKKSAKSNLYRLLITRKGVTVMKINPYIQVQQLYNTKKVGETKKATSAGRTDGVVISNIGVKFRLLSRLFQMHRTSGKM